LTNLKINGKIKNFNFKFFLKNLKLEKKINLKKKKKKQPK